MSIYWTKPERDEQGMPAGVFETIKEEKELPYVPDGDGFEIDLGSIKYKDYLKAPEEYDIVYGKLVKIAEEVSSSEPEEMPQGE